MGEVKRYDLERSRRPFDESSSMVAREDGEWISADDYARLERDHAEAQAELARLRAEVERLRVDSSLLDWIEGQFKTHSVHMDGTSAFALTGKELRGLRGRSFRAAVAAACGRNG